MDLLWAAHTPRCCLLSSVYLGLQKFKSLRATKEKPRGTVKTAQKRSGGPWPRRNI